MKPVPGYEVLYSVTRDGRVWSHPKKMHDGRWLKQAKRKGYPFVDLSKQNITRKWSVHRLMAITYLQNPNNYSQINHKNGIKDDNHLENIEWCSPSQNKQHAWDTGLIVVTDAKRAASRRNAYVMMAKRIKGRIIKEVA